MASVSVLSHLGKALEFLLPGAGGQYGGQVAVDGAGGGEHASPQAGAGAGGHGGQALLLEGPAGDVAVRLPVRELVVGHVAAIALEEEQRGIGRRWGGGLQCNETVFVQCVCSSM